MQARLKKAGKVKRGWQGKRLVRLKRLTVDTEIAVYRGLIEAEERRLAR